MALSKAFAWTLELAKTTSTLASLREETIISPWLSSVLVQLHF